MDKFYIRKGNSYSKQELVEVDGKPYKAFGYNFFIHREDTNYCISEVTTGMLAAKQCKLKDAKAQLKTRSSGLKEAVECSLSAIECNRVFIENLPQYRAQFKAIFGFDLRLHPLFGFDIVAFDKHLQCPENVSCSEVVLQRYGQVAHDLVETLAAL